MSEGSLLEADRLAKLALARLPKPYTDEVLLHVFCEIERTPHLRRDYDQLIEVKGYAHAGLNSLIAKAITKTLKAIPYGKLDVSGVCEIVNTPSRLHGVDSEWSW